MELTWTAEVFCKQYKATTIYRDDFGVFDCYIYNTKTNQYVHEATYVGCNILGVIDIVENWFKENISDNLTESQITSNSERSLLNMEQWHLEVEEPEKDKEIWRNMFAKGEIEINKYSGITWVQGNHASVKRAMNILSRFDQEAGNQND